MYLLDLRPFFSLWRVLILMGLQEKLSKNSLKAVEDDLELLYKEDQLKMNSLDIMIPLHLNQVKKKKNSTYMLHSDVPVHTWPIKLILSLITFCQKLHF